MKILITQETDWLKRNPIQQHHLAETLSLRGHDIRVIDYELLWKTQGKRELYSRRQVFSGIFKIHNGARVTLIHPGIIKIPGLDYVSLIFSHRKEIKRQIRQFKPDVIVGFGILNSYLDSKAAKESNIPFVYYWIDVLHLLVPFKPFRLLAKLVEKEALKRADRVLVINDKLRDYVVGLGAFPQRTQVLRTGIDIGQFKLNVNGNSIRKQYGLDEQDLVLFFMGWLYEFSGLKEVTWQLMQIADDKLKLLIVGEGDAYKELKKMREKYNLQDRLILTGKKPYHEIPNFIAASDVCLLPAYPNEPIMQDIVPIKMYEYMAMKKPVIATKLPGVMREFGEDNGVVYVDHPEGAIAKAVALVKNGNVGTLGSKARSFVERNSWDNITDEFEEILAQVINEKHNAVTCNRR